MALMACLSCEQSNGPVKKKAPGPARDNAMTLEEKIAETERLNSINEEKFDDLDNYHGSAYNRKLREYLEFLTEKSPMVRNYYLKTIFEEKPDFKIKTKNRLLLAGRTRFEFELSQKKDLYSVDSYRDLLKKIGKKNASGGTTITHRNLHLMSQDASSGFGRWRPRNNSQKNKKIREKMKELSSLSYLQGYNPAPLKSGVTIHNSEKVYKGLNFFTSGHQPAAFIMDMKGDILFKWEYYYWNIWPESDPRSNEPLHFWQRAYPLENGDLLAIYDSFGIIRLDRDSNLLWVHEMAHHDMDMDEKGRIHVLTRKKEFIPELKKDLFVDYITVLNPEGQLIKSYSLLDLFENSDYYSMIELFYQVFDRIDVGNEIFHTNTLTIFDGSQAHVSPFYKKGNLLISCLHLNTIAIIDPEQKKVVWALEGSGLWIKMHEPVLLKNGHMLIFDNSGNRGKSKVIEFDPFTKKIFWNYSKKLDSETVSSAYELPNGNVLITETDNGRAIEVTRDKKMVWEYINPHRTGKDNDLIATLQYMTRINEDDLSWLNEDKGLTR